MSNRIFAMYEIIKSAFEEDSVRRERPFTNILVPIIDNETELKNELADLKDSIKSEAFTELEISFLIFL